MTIKPDRITDNQYTVDPFFEKHFIKLCSEDLVKSKAFNVVSHGIFRRMALHNPAFSHRKYPDMLYSFVIDFTDIEVLPKKDKRFCDHSVGSAQMFMMSVMTARDLSIALRETYGILWGVQDEDERYQRREMYKDYDEYDGTYLWTLTEDHPFFAEIRYLFVRTFELSLYKHLVKTHYADYPTMRENPKAYIFLRDALIMQYRKKTFKPATMHLCTDEWLKPILRRFHGHAGALRHDPQREPRFFIAEDKTPDEVMAYKYHRQHDYYQKHREDNPEVYTKRLAEAKRKREIEWQRLRDERYCEADILLARSANDQQCISFLLSRQREAILEDHVAALKTAKNRRYEANRRNADEEKINDGRK